MTIVPVPHPEPYPFVWFPLNRERHAIDRRDRNVPRGTLMRCLCGVSYPRGPDGDMEQMWPTCQQCWNETCIIAGLHPHR